MKKRATYGLIAALAVAAIVGVVSFISYSRPQAPPGVSKQAFARLRHGMTKKQVDRLLGAEVSSWAAGGCTECRYTATRMRITSS